ncbi:MAG: hypothetical protein NXI00_14015 [Cytophagales bacterium]|nr:hypothetical protein [Cytophagales bacterium]
MPHYFRRVITISLVFANFLSISQPYNVETGLPLNLLQGTPQTITGLSHNTYLGGGYFGSNYKGPFEIGFGFVFFGKTKSQFFISSNGYISFDQGYSASNLGPIPSPAGYSYPKNWIAFAASSLAPGLAGSTINYFTYGTSPNRVLVINFLEVQHQSFNNPKTSIQLQLHEGSNTIEIHNIDNQSNGTQRTLGVLNFDGTEGYSPSGMVQSSTLNLVNEMIRFTTCEFPSQPVILASDDGVLCPSKSSKTLTSSCSLGSLSWSTGETTSSITVSPTKDSTYSVSCNNSGCQTSSNYYVEVLDKPIITPDNDREICIGSNEKYSISPYSKVNSNYQWIKDGIDISGASDSVFYIQSGGAYSVRHMKEGCYTISDTVNISVSTQTVNKPRISASESYVCGRGSPVDFTVTGCSGNVNWHDINNSSIIWSSSPSGNSSSAYIYQDTKFVVSCTENGCNSEFSDTLNVGYTSVKVNAEDNLICPGGQLELKTISYPDTGLVGYKWYRNAVLIPDSIRASFLATQPGTYNVYSIYSNGCETYSSQGSFVLSSSAVLPNPDIGVIKSVISGEANKVFDVRFGGAGNDFGADIKKDPTGNFVISGSSHGSQIGGDKTKTSFGSDGDYWVLKIDSTGNKIWDNVLGGSYHEWVAETKINEFGEILVFGTSKSGASGNKSMANTSSYIGPYPEYQPTYNDIWLVKLNSNGLIIWDKKIGGYGSDEVRFVEQLSTNEFMIGGSTNSPISGEVTLSGKGGQDYWLIKIDSSGNKSWERRYGGSGNDYIYKILKSSANSFYLIGKSSSPSNGDKTEANLGDEDIWIVKIDESGNKLWDKTLGSAFIDDGVDAIFDKNEDLIVSYLTYNNESHIVKLGKDGNLFWDKKLDQTQLFGKLTDNEQGFILVGLLFENSNLFDQSVKGGGDGAIIQFDSLGNKIWSKLLGGTGFDSFYDFVTEGDEIVAFGSSNSPVSFDKTHNSRGGNDYWFVKTSLNQRIEEPVNVNLEDTTTIYISNCPGKATWSAEGIGYITNSKYIEQVIESPATYSVTCEAYGCSNTGSIDIGVNCSIGFKVSEINSTDENSVLSTCSENTDVTLVALGCSGTVTWFDNTQGNQITISQITDSTYYSATCTDLNCTPVQDSLLIVFLETPVLSINQSSFICIGDSIKLIGSSQLNYSSYIWQKNDIEIETTTVKELWVSESGLYNLKIEKNNCSAGSNTLEITVNNTIPPSPTLPVDTMYICNGESVYLEANGCETGIAFWSNDSTGQAIYTKPIYTDTSFTVTCTINSCTSDESTPLHIKIPEISIKESSKILSCNTEGKTFEINKPNTPGTFNWFLNETLLIGDTLDFITTNIAGIYTVSMTLKNGCVLYSNPVELSTFSLDSFSILATAIGENPKDTLIQIWDKTFGGSEDEFFNDILVTSDKHLLLVGTTYSVIDSNQNQGNSDVYIIKIDTLGNKIWERTFGTSYYEGGISAAETQNGSFLILANSNETIDGDKTAISYGNTDFWLLKIDGEGNLLWDNSYGTTYIDLPLGIITSSDDNFLLYGSQRATFGSTSKYYVLKVDSAGNTIWEKTFSGGLSDNLVSVVESTDELGYLLVGHSNSNANFDKSDPSFGQSDIWIIKTDTSGNKIWDKTYGGTHSEVSASIQEINNNQLLISGSSYSTANGNKTSTNYGQYDFWLIKTDSLGNTIWDRNYGGNLTDQAKSSYLNSIGNLILTGNTSSDISHDITQASFGGSPYWSGGNDGWMIEIDTATGNIIHQMRIGGSDNETIVEHLELNKKKYLVGTSYSNIGGSKFAPSKGSSDFWITNFISSSDSITSDSVMIISPNDSVTIYTTNCPGKIVWSTGSENPYLNISPNFATSYEAKCISYDCQKIETLEVKVFSCGQFLSIIEDILEGTPALPINKNAYGNITATNRVGSEFEKAATKYISGGSIELNPGFLVNSGSLFGAEISSNPCK